LQVLRISTVSIGLGMMLCTAGCRHAPPVILACSASAPSIYPGDPVTVTATAGDIDPKLKAIYSWSGAGVTGSGITATVATASLAPGTYTVKGEVKEGKLGKEGLKPGQTADCSASFTVKAFEPPAISCSASPNYIQPGDTSTVTVSGVSPQNRPLTYSYSSTRGTISGRGSTASYSSAGAPTGDVGITCSVTDDKGQTATANTSVMIAAPPPPPSEYVQLESRLALHSIFFPPDQPSTTNSDGGLLASQQATLTTLATDFKSYLELKPDAHLILTGHADEAGSAEYNRALSERRVARTKQFLVEQGVPEASIETRALGREQNLTAGQVKDLVEQNPNLNAAEREKALRDLAVIVLAQNRRVDFTLRATGQQSMRLYPFSAADSLTLLGKEAPNGGPASPGASSPLKACNAFVLFGYPVKIDLGQKEQLPQSFRLIAGNFDPTQGIVASGIQDLLCEAAGQRPGCIPVSVWQKVSRGCDERPAQDFATDKNTYEFQIWPILDTLPDSVCEVLQFPGSWIETDGKDQTQCQPSIDGVFSWRWFAKIKDPSFKPPGDTYVELSLTSNTNPARAVSPRLQVDLQPKPQTRLEQAKSWAERQFEENLWKWICGIMAALFAAFSPKLPKWVPMLVKKGSAEKPQATAVPPTIIVVTPPPENRSQLNPPNSIPEPRRRSTHRWRRNGE
jgi:outer membrane protein OmpA-like peptidoglycan-associated protein